MLRILFKKCISEMNQILREIISQSRERPKRHKLENMSPKYYSNRFLRIHFVEKDTDIVF